MLLRLLVLTVALVSLQSNARESKDVKQFLILNGYENPHLIKLMTLNYAALRAIHDRIERTKKELLQNDFESKKVTDEARKKGLAETKTILQKRLERSKRQYRLAFELNGLLIDRSVTDYDLRGLREKNKAIFEPSSDPAVREKNDIQIKTQILERARELFLGALKFLALKPDPVPTRTSVNQDNESGIELAPADHDNYAWLDRPEFDLKSSTKVAVQSFIEGKGIEFYRNVDLITTATQIANGYRRLLHTDALKKYALDEPESALQEGLAEVVLGGDDILKAAGININKVKGLVTFYLHVLGTILDGYNGFTHDSYDLMRASLTMLLLHVTDIEGNANLSAEQASEYIPLPQDAPNYMPIRDAILRANEVLKTNFMKDVAAGPKLEDPQADRNNKLQEWLQYHGNLIKNLYGTNFTHWIWPKKGDTKADDVRLQLTSTRGEGRDARGNPLAEMQEIQSGDMWLEKGTGQGSVLISWATQASPPKGRTKTLMTEPSTWNLISNSLYYKFSHAMGWMGEKLNVDASEWDQPGIGVDYTGASHTGLVEVYEVPGRPQLTRTDFVDAFPNLMRQAWRGHGCGHMHSRKCLWLRVRNEWARNYVNTFAAKFQATEEDLKRRLAPAVREYRSAVIADDPNNLDASENLCKTYLTQTLNFQNEEEMMANRGKQRPAYKYCLGIFQRKGMKHFRDRIMPQAGQLTDAQLTKAMGKLVVEISSNIRNARGWEEGFGVRFDDRFDEMTKARLYCSEFAHLSYLLAWGQDVYPMAQFRKSLRDAQGVLPENTVAGVTGGFFKVPYGDDDFVHAPQGVLEDPRGVAVFRVIGEMRRTAFGIIDE